MGFITVGIEYDSYGRPCEKYIHTDDMSDEDYSNLCKAQCEEKRLLNLRSGNKPECVYNALGDGTLMQLKEARKEIRKIINKYT